MNNINRPNDRPQVYQQLVFPLFCIVAYKIINHFILGNQEDFQSDYHATKNITLLYPLLKPGDLLEYPRNHFEIKYSHWAVYIGTKITDNGEIQYRIIHHSTPPESSPVDVASSMFSEDRTHAASIREDNVIDPLHSDLELIRVNNANDRVWDPFDGDEVVARAKNLMEDPDTSGYNLFKNNCEHFANKCRYDKLVSNEVHRKFIDTIAAAAKKNEL